jgi:hypothetical protein
VIGSLNSHPQRGTFPLIDWREAAHDRRPERVSHAIRPLCAICPPRSLSSWDAHGTGLARELRAKLHRLPVLSIPTWCAWKLGRGNYVKASCRGAVLGETAPAEEAVSLGVGRLPADLGPALAGGVPRLG